MDSVSRSLQTTCVDNQTYNIYTYTLLNTLAPKVDRAGGRPVVFLRTVKEKSTIKHKETRTHVQMDGCIYIYIYKFKLHVVKVVLEG